MGVVLGVENNLTGVLWIKRGVHERVSGQEGQGRVERAAGRMRGGLTCLASLWSMSP